MMRQKALNTRIAERADVPESTGELPHGQIVIVAARWVLVLSGFLLVIWNPAQIGTLRVEILMIFLLAVANFYLHAQTLMRRPVLPEVIYATSAADLVIVTVFIVVSGGFSSDLYIFYFPAIVALAVVFPTALTLWYTAITAAFYAGISLLTIQSTFPALSNDLQVLLSRVVILVAVAVCSNVFLRIERDRRRAAVHARAELAAEIGKRATPAEPKKDHPLPVQERS